jgi:ADP-heptose:LPS heptosyltransferase
MKILAIRTDRLGDVLLTLPALAVMREDWPGCALGFLCSRTVAPVIGPFLQGKQIDLIDSIDWGRILSYDAMIFFSTDHSLALRAWFHGTCVRYGVFSKPVSWLAFNAGKRQSRSRAEMNEAEYNVDLARSFARYLGKESLSPVSGICLPVNDKARAQVHEKLRLLGTSPDSPFIAIHPGMGGSALNLSARQYQKIITDIEGSGIPIVISQGPACADGLIVQAISSVVKCPIVNNATLPQTMEMFRMARLVIAPGTGTLHLAHYVGTPVLGVYSPVRAHCTARWRPWGGDGPVSIVEPSVKCGGKKNCRGKRCHDHYCMEEFPLDRVVSLTRGYFQGDLRYIDGKNRSECDRQV